MRGGHKDGLCTDTIHVDTHSRLQVIQVNVAVLCDQIYDTMLTSNLRKMTRERKCKCSATFSFGNIRMGRSLPA